MCRSIRPLRVSQPPTTDGDVSAAALQFVRKVSGTRAPSRAAAPAFELAVTEVAAATARLLAALGSGPVAGPPTPPALWPAQPASRRRPRPGRDSIADHPGAAADPAGSR